MEREVVKLRRENERLQARLEQAEAIIEVQKRALASAWSSHGEERGRRAHMIQTAEALGERLGIAKACQVLGVPRSSLYWARQPERATDSESARRPRPTPQQALSEEEKAEVHQTLDSVRFWDCSPREAYATLLDEGVYPCHWRTMYRILDKHGEVQERRNQLRHPVYSRPELLATGPNQVWRWDITKLKGPVPWTYYYLYAILDIFGHYVVGWMIAGCESAELASN